MHFVQSELTKRILIYMRSCRAVLDVHEREVKGMWWRCVAVQKVC